ncbi:phospholipase D family protein [Gordonia phosphorivorans]|uniref:Phospholipase D family protein n=1 Tax=Gordonia phosphorivorans TaxID=1056982 RepID=A0ABV6HA85_9ACTN
MKQKTDALLDLWQPPLHAGDPVGVLATTFSFEPDFFEANCLARFLSVETVSEGAKSITDLVGEIELQQALRTTDVTVLADRSQAADRTTLQWDALHCLVPTGLLHSKISILLWQNAARVLIGSANLTQAGYRSNIEIVVSADLGPDCLLPRNVLDQIANEVASYLDLVPGLAPDSGARERAERLLGQFRERIADSSASAGKVLVSAAPTNPSAQPLEQLNDVWKHGRPLIATHLSPFWDSGDPRVLETVGSLLTGRPASEREHIVLTTINQQAEVYFPAELNNLGLIDGVYELPTIDEDGRPLHAKCLQVSNADWVAVLVGSSNHTVPGLGLSPASRRHREMNIWLGAPRSSKEGAALEALLRCGNQLDMEITTLVDTEDDEEADITPLPAFFGYCEARTVDDHWILRFGFDPDAKQPAEWWVRSTAGQSIVTSHDWRAAGAPATVDWTLSVDDLMTQVVVEWDGHEGVWPVVVDDPLVLPPPPTLASLRAHQLLAALADRKSISQAVREQLESEAVKTADLTPVDDPHKRFESDQYLLRRGRALGRSLTQMERLLSRPAATVDVLRARLAAPLGPLFIADRLAHDAHDGTVPSTEAAFTIAEVALSVGRVDWAIVVEPFADDTPNAMDPVADTIAQLTALSTSLTDVPEQMAAYCARACAHARNEVAP